MNDGKEDSNGLLEEGRRHLRGGDAARALAAFERALSLDGDNEHALFETANAHVRGGNDALAAAAYGKVLRVNPFHDMALVELGKLHCRRRENAAAKALFEKAVAANPGNANARRELGRLLRQEGDYARSREELERASSLAPDDTSLARWLKDAGAVPGDRKEKAPYRVFFTWGMNYECNYRCSYCYAPKPEQPGFERNAKYATAYPGTERIIRAWDAVADAYGSCRIRLDGGEPSAYPGFRELVRHLSARHRLQVNTNLSFDVSSFCRDVRPEQVRVDASFHREYVPLEDFLAKVRALRGGGFKTVVSFVAYPPFVEDIPRCTEAFGKEGVPFIVHPFSGIHQGKTYPRDYGSEEKKIIYKSDRESRTELEWRSEEMPRRDSAGAAGNVSAPVSPVRPAASGAPGPDARKLCRMGYLYARIYPNGDVYRCCTDDGLLRLGNLYDGSLRLLEEAAPCDHAGCRCWRCMIVGEERRWLPTWMDDWEMPF